MKTVPSGFAVIVKLPVIRYIALPALFGILSVYAQNGYPDVLRFADSAQHWYRIFDDERVIEPVPDQPRYDESDYIQIADNILLFQKANGGWAKNYDMQAILNQDQINAVQESKHHLNTTFDNGATHGQISYLAEVYSRTTIKKYKAAFIQGIEFTLKAQYDNGGWPQFFPDTSGYRKYITFNDNAMTGIMVMFHKIVTGNPDYGFVTGDLLNHIETAYESGITCILNCQIIEHGMKTAWCQQHDQKNFMPREARNFEKPSICNRESVALTKFLMQIHHPSAEIIDAIESSMQWYRDSEIHGIRQEWIEAEEETFIYHKSKYDKILVEDDEAPRIWARFYELGTHVPIFCGRDGIVRYAMSEIDRDRRTGYGWYVYDPEELYTEYPEWKKKTL
ncbi:pectate lyase [bacterium]|nr:pectate lyase [bacterium]